MMFENEFLTALYSEEDVRVAALGIEQNKAPRLEVFPAEFYLKFWNIMKEDLMDLLKEFCAENFRLSSLNFGVITLLEGLKTLFPFSVGKSVETKAYGEDEELVDFLDDDQTSFQVFYNDMRCA